MSEITVGAEAPAFSAPAVTREGESTISLVDYLGKYVVVYFYPKDDTPGCTTQACGFRDHRPDYEAVGAVILGISPDDATSHAKFSEKFTLPFPLVSDPDHAIAEAYGVWKEKTNYGKTYMGIERTTFVIDKDGKIAKIYPRVKVDQHAEKVLEFLRSL
ncbi:MAG: Peroxiredoxin [Capsulimonas sp.]|nr:Peroxiredoxin [Capsulimonas sp.]